MKGNDIRKLIIEMHYRAGVGHIGCSLSVADIVAAVNPGSSEDRIFILSKGHAASALYAALHLNGHIEQDELFTYCQPGSRLQVHPEANLPHVPIATGSLGMGPSMGCGFAIAHPDKRVIVLVSDAELNEGSVWEAIMFAGHHKLANYHIVVDFNNQQALGRAEDILRIHSLSKVVEGFGCDYAECDGHDIKTMRNWIDAEGVYTATGAPRLLVAHTTFGKGERFMESSVEWHYKPMNEHEYTAVMANLSCESNL